MDKNKTESLEKLVNIVQSMDLQDIDDISLLNDPTYHPVVSCSGEDMGFNHTPTNVDYPSENLDSVLNDYPVTPCNCEGDVEGYKTDIQETTCTALLVLPIVTQYLDEEYTFTRPKVLSVLNSEEEAQDKLIDLLRTGNYKGQPLHLNLGKR